MPYTAEKRRVYERERDKKRRRDPGRKYVRAETARRRRAVKKATERPTFGGYGTGKHGRKVEAFLREIWETDPALYIRVTTKIHTLTDAQLEKRERRDSTATKIVNGLFALAEERMEQQNHSKDDRPAAGRRDQNGGFVIVVLPYGSFPEKHRRAQKLGSTFEAILVEALRSRRVT